MTSFETLDEIYLMTISGMAPIARITYLEKLAPFIPKYPKPVQNTSVDVQDDQESNSTVSHGYHRGDTLLRGTDLSSEFDTEVLSESFSIDNDSNLNLSSV